MERKTVLQIIDKLSMDGVNPSSCTRLFGDWIPRFDEQSFRFAVCTLRDPDPAGAYLEQRGIRVHYRGHGRFSWANVRSIMELIEQEQADIVHLHGYSAANFGRLAARRKGVVNVVHEHATLRVLPHQFVADRLLRRHTDAAIAVSRSVREFMLHGRSIPQERIEVIGNGVPLERFSRVEPDRTRALRAQLGIAADAPLIGTLTRLREEKGNEFLIKALPEIGERFPGVVLVIAGEGPQRAELEGLARRLDVLDRVMFLGHFDDPAALLSLVDVNVIASLTEGFPLCLVEAMSVGVPIVATRVGGMAEIGQDGQNLLFVEPRDPQAIAASACRLLESPELRRRLGENAQAASTAHGVDQSVEALSRFYVRLCGASGARMVSLN